MTLERVQKEELVIFVAMVSKLSKHGGDYTQFDAWRVLVLATLTYFQDWCSLTVLAKKVNHRWLLHHPHILTDERMNLLIFANTLTSWGLLKIKTEHDDSFVQLTRAGRELGKIGRKFINREMSVYRRLIKIKRKKGKKSRR